MDKTLEVSWKRNCFYHSALYTTQTHNAGGGAEDWGGHKDKTFEVSESHFPHLLRGRILALPTLNV